MEGPHRSSRCQTHWLRLRQLFCGRVQAVAAVARAGQALVLVSLCSATAGWGPPKSFQNGAKLRALGERKDKRRTSQSINPQLRQSANTQKTMHAGIPPGRLSRSRYSLSSSNARSMIAPVAGSVIPPHRSATSAQSRRVAMSPSTTSRIDLCICFPGNGNATQANQWEVDEFAREWELKTV